MHAIRAFFAHHRALALWLVAAALCMKALVPAGYMAQRQGHVLTISICAESLGHSIARQIVIPSKSGDPTAPSAGEHCAFSALDHAAMGGADPVLLAMALAFAMVLGLLLAPLPPLARRAFAQPPLRGPPARA